MKEDSTCLRKLAHMPIVTTRYKTGWFSIYTTLTFELCQAGVLSLPATRPR